MQVSSLLVLRLYASITVLHNKVILVLQLILFGILPRYSVSIESLMHVSSVQSCHLIIFFIFFCHLEPVGSGPISKEQGQQVLQGWQV